MQCYGVLEGGSVLVGPLVAVERSSVSRGIALYNNELGYWSKGHGEEVEGETDIRAFSSGLHNSAK